MVLRMILSPKFIFCVVALLVIDFMYQNVGTLTEF